MKIIGPIAGTGTRLRPFTFKKPKAFIKVAGKTVLDHILDKLKDTFDQSTELILIVGYKKEQIIDYINKNYSKDFNLTFIEQTPRGFDGDVPYYWGLGEAIYLAKKQFNFQEDDLNKKSINEKKDGCLIFLGDMIPLDEYSFILNRYYESDVDGIITVMRVPKEEASSYGIVSVDDNMIIKNLVEKPKEFISDLAIAGPYAFSRKTTNALFNNIKKHLDNKSETSGEIYMTPALQDLIDQNYKIAAVELEKGILDFGRTTELLKGNRYILEHMAQINEKSPTQYANYKYSVINTPVNIEENTEITHSIIGPYVSIGKNCKLKKCILKNCLIEDGAYLSNIITENSIIGSYVKIDNLSKDNLMIGDKCQLVLNNDK